VLGEEIEARLKGFAEPSVEKLKEAIRNEIRMVEEKFLVDILNSRGERATEKQAPSVDKAYRKSASETPEKDPDPEAGLTKKTSPCQEGLYIPDTDHTLRTMSVLDLKELRSKETEAVRQFKYVDELCTKLEFAVLGGKCREVKCHRRALALGLRLAEEAIIRTAEVHKWTKAVLERALDDVRGLTLSWREDADKFLSGEK
jgi:hypothetical protein